MLNIKAHPARACDRVMFTFTTEGGQTGYILFYKHRNPSVHFRGTIKNIGSARLHMLNATGQVWNTAINLADPQFMYEVRQNGRYVQTVRIEQDRVQIRFEPGSPVTIQGRTNVTGITLNYLATAPAGETTELYHARN